LPLSVLKASAPMEDKMIADDCSGFDFSPIFSAVRKIARLFRRRKPIEIAPRTQLIEWIRALKPDQRAIVLALLSADEPLTNRELARRAGISAGECSKRVSALNGALVKNRSIKDAREVRIALPQHLH
jgi:DNA-directed RNA polymerase specialized sigma24 family protein